MKPFQSQPAGVRHPDWQKVYHQVPVDELPWRSLELDPEIKRTLPKLAFCENSRLLDIGGGDGSQAVHLAEMGFAVTVLDVSAAGLELLPKHPALSTVLGDILEVQFEVPFDIAIDRGCFHVLDRPDLYPERVAAALRPQGYLMLKVFSEAERDSGFGPYRYNLATLRLLFSPWFELQSWQKCVFQGSRVHSPKSLFCLFRRKS